MKKLFSLRGELDKKTESVLQVIGLIIFVVTWGVLSSSLNTSNVTQMDRNELNTKGISIEDSKYYYNDSLLVADIDLLLNMGQDELATYGLKQIVVSNLPHPVDVLKAIPEMIKKVDLLSNIAISVKLNLLGYLYAILISIIVGFTLGLIPLLRGMFSQIVNSGRFIPLSALTGIFILWLGIDSGMKVTFLAFGILVYLIPVVIQRIDEVSEVYLQTTYTLGATSWQTVKSVYIPYVMGKLIDDIRVLTAISWTYITIAEMLNKSGGIGQIIWEAKRQSNIEYAFGILVVIVLIGLIQDRLFVLLNKLLFPYKFIQTKN